MNPQQPPPQPYYGQQYPYGPPKKSTPRWIWGTMIGCFGSIFVVIGLLAAVLYPVFARVKDRTLQNICTTHLRDMGMQMQMYAQDNNECLPPADRWMDALGSYQKKQTTFHCTARKPLRSDTYGYSMNAAEASKSATAMASGGKTTPLVYDSDNLEKNASDPVALQSLPKAGRHHQGNNILYADGHSHWLNVSSKDVDWGNHRDASR